MFHIFLEIGKTVGIHNDIEIDDTLNIRNRNTPDLNVVQLINILTNFLIICHTSCCSRIYLDSCNKTDSIDYVVDHLQDDTKALATGVAQ